MHSTHRWRQLISLNVRFKVVDDEFGCKKSAVMWNTFVIQSDASQWYWDFWMDFLRVYERNGPLADVDSIVSWTESNKCILLVVSHRRLWRFQWDIGNVGVDAMFTSWGIRQPNTFLQISQVTGNKVEISGANFQMQMTGRISLQSHASNDLADRSDYRIQIHWSMIKGYFVEVDALLGRIIRQIQEWTRFPEHRLIGQIVNDTIRSQHTFGDHELNHSIYFRQLNARDYSANAISRIFRIKPVNCFIICTCFVQDWKQRRVNWSIDPNQCHRRTSRNNCCI